MPDGEEQQQPDPQALAEENARLKAELAAARQVANEEQSRSDNLSRQSAQVGDRAKNELVARLGAQAQAADGALASIDQEMKALKRQLVALNQEGKFDEAADVQEQISDAAARRREATQQKAYFEQQKTNASQQSFDPVEQFLTANKGTYSEADENWIRQNRRFAEDPAFRNRVIAAHSEAIDKNIAPGTPDYYRYVERRGYMRPEQPSQQDQQQQQQPVSTGGPAPTGYDGGSPESDSVQPAPYQGRQQMPAENGAPAFGRQAQNPQPAAAGSGSLRQAIAAAPSRQQPRPDGRQVVAEMPQEQFETAMAMAPHMAPQEVLNGGPAAIAQWYLDLNNSPTARRIRQGWG